MENSFSSIIDSASSVLILLPSKPYFDQVAAGLALYLAIKEKKETSIASSAPMVVEFNRLVGVDKITQELGNKNLVISFSGYKATDVERVNWDIENSELKLTVIPKPGISSPKREQVQFTYSGVAADTVILIGGGNDSHFPELVSPDLAGSKLVHIGTRSLAVSSGKQVMSFAKPGSSVSEVVASLIKENGLTIDPDIATNLVAGIEEGSREFKGADVTPETFETFAKLLRDGGKRVPKQEFGPKPYPVGAIPGQSVVTEEPEKKEPEAPNDWLEPKIYKGTSVS